MAAHLGLHSKHPFDSACRHVQTHKLAEFLTLGSGKYAHDHTVLKLGGMLVLTSEHHLGRFAHSQFNVLTMDCLLSEALGLPYRYDPSCNNYLYHL